MEQKNSDEICCSRADRFKTVLNSIHKTIELSVQEELNKDKKFNAELLDGWLSRHNDHKWDLMAKVLSVDSAWLKYGTGMPPKAIGE